MQKFLKREKVGQLTYFPLKFLLKLFQLRNKGIFFLLLKKLCTGCKVSKKDYKEQQHYFLLEESIDRNGVFKILTLSFRLSVAPCF